MDAIVRGIELNVIDGIVILGICFVIWFVIKGVRTDYED